MFFPQQARDDIVEIEDIKGMPHLVLPVSSLDNQ